MATEASIPEVISHTKGLVEDTYFTAGQFEKTVTEGLPVESKKGESQLNEYPETHEFTSEKKQVAGSTEVEIVNNVVGSNFGTIEEGGFLTAPSGPTVSNEEASKPEHRPVEVLNPSDIEISDNTKHLEKDLEFGVLEETAREGEGVEQKNHKVDQDHKNNDIQSNIETSSNVTKTGEPKFEVEGEEIGKNTINLDQNVDVILNQQDSVNDGPRSTEKETKDSEKDEGGKMEDSQTEVFSKEVPSILEATLDHNNEVSVHTPDSTVNEDVQSVNETCSKDEKIETEDNKDESTLDVSTIASRQESQNNETGDSVKEKVDRVSVADEVDVQEEEEKDIEVLGTPCTEINQDTNELSKQEKDEAPIEHEMQDKSSSVTLFDAKAEEEISRELDNPDILKVHPEIKSDYIAKETQIEVKHTEVLEETDQVNATTSGNVNTDENSERELDSSSRKHEDIHGQDKGLDITEASVEEAQQVDISPVKLVQAEELTELNPRKHHPDPRTEAAVEEAQDAEGSSLVAAEDISTVKFVQAEELTELDSTKHEECPDYSLLPQNEPEEKKLQAHLNLTSEEIKSAEFSGNAAIIDSIKEEGENKKLEETSEKKEKGEEPIAICDISGNEIPIKEITNLPSTHSDNETENTVAELPKNDVDNSHVLHSSVEQAEVQEEKIDGGDLESHEKDQKLNEASRKEVKPDEDESEPYQSTEEKVLQHTSTEGTVPPEIELKTSESTEKPEKDYGLNSKESLDSEDAGEDISEEVKKEAEVTDTDTQKFTTKSHETEEGSLLDDVQFHNTVRAVDDPIIQVEIPEEETLKSKGEDESQRPESKGGNSNKEETVEEDVKFSIPEPIQGEISKSNEDNVEDAEKLTEEESTTEILKEGGISALSPKSIQEDAIKTLKDHEKEAERSKEEVVKEIETAGAGETNKDVEVFADASSVEQEGQQEEGEYLDPIEDSVEENKVEGILSTEVVKEDDDNKVKESERVLEVASKGEEDQPQAFQKDEQEEKLENLIHLTPPETETEPSREEAKNLDGTNDSEKEISEELETTGTGESIPFETNKDIEKFVGASSVKQEDQKEVDQELDPGEALKEENKVEGTFSAEVVEGGYENNVKATERSIEVASKGEANQQILPEEIETEPGNKLENVLHATSENIETGPPSKDATNNTYTEDERTIQNLEETLVTEKKGEKAENTDGTKDSEKEISEKFETTGASESIPCETEVDVESFVLASLVKQEDQEEVNKELDPVEALKEENKVLDTFSAKAVEEAYETNVKATERSIEVASKGEAKQQILPEETKTEPGDKLENVLHAPPEETETGLASDDATNITSMEEEGTTQNETEKKGEKEENTDSTKDSEKEIFEELETVGVGESIPSEKDEGVEKFVVASSVKQEDQQELDKKLDPVASIKEESKVEDKFSTEVVEEDYENNVKTTERSIEVASKGEANQQISPEETEIEPASGDATNITCTEGEGVIQDLTETSETENNRERAKKTDNANDSEKEISEELETSGAGENVPCDTNKDLEKFVVASPVKQDHQEVDKELDPAEALKEENKAEDTFSAKVVEEDYENNVKATERSIEVAPKAEANQQILPEETKTEPEDKLENVPHALPEETETGPAIEDATNITCIEEEGTIQKLEETSETETKEEKAENVDSPNVSEKEVSEELETVEAGESIPSEKNKDIENFVVASSVKQEDQQEVNKELDLVESLKEESKVEDTFSTKVVEEHYENNVPATERSIEVASEGNANQQTLPEETETEPGEKLENVPHVTPEETETEPSSQDATNTTCTEGEGVIQDLKETSETENNGEKTNDSEKEISEELETSGAGENIPCDTNKDVEKFVVAPPVKQEDYQEVDKELDPVEALKEGNKVEDTFSASVVEEDYENNVKTTEKSTEIASKGEANQQILPEETETEPREKPEIVLDATPEETKTGPASEDATNITCVEEEGTIQKLEETLQTEKKGEKAENVDGTNISEKEISEELETVRAGESIPSEKNEDVENFVVSSSVKQEDHQEVDKELDTVESLKEESKVEDTFSTAVVEEDYQNNIKGTEKGIEVASKGEANQEILPEETETEPASGDATNITCTDGEGVIQETSETKNKGENVKNTENANDSKKEVHENTSTGQETREQVLRELDSVKDLYPKFTDTETAEDTKESQGIAGLETATPSTETERENLDEQGTAEVSSLSLGEDIVEESLTEIEKEEDTHFELKEQNEVTDSKIKPESLEDSEKSDKDFGTIKTTETPVEEKVAGEETHEKEPITYGSDCVSTEIHSEETTLKEVEPDNKEKGKSHDITLEEKSLANSGDIEEQLDSLLPEILSEETGLKEAEPDNKERDKSYKNVPKEGGLENSVETGVQSDSVSIGTAGEKTSLREGGPDNEEQVKSYDIAHSTILASEETSLEEAEPDNDDRVRSYEIAPEENSLASNVDIQVQSRSFSTEILSEETGIKEAKEDHEEQASGFNTALEEKDAATNVDIDVQDDSVSTKIVKEETSLNEGEPDNEEYIKNFDIASEEKCVVADVDVELQSEFISAGTESEETSLKEAKRDHDEHVNGSMIALEEKELATNVDTKEQYDSVSTRIANEETSSKDVEPDNEDQVKSFDTTTEKKGVVTDVDVELQSESVSAGTESEETCLKEAKRDHEEPVNNLNIAVEEKDLASNADINEQDDSVSTGIANEETSSKEAEQGNVDQVKSFDIAPEEKGVVTDVDVELQSDSISAGTDSGETSLKEAKQDQEEDVNNLNVALEEKDLTSNVDIAEQNDSLSTGIVNEEPSPKEAKPDKEEQGIAPEDKGIVSSIDIEVQPDSVSAGTKSEETSLKETKQDHEEQVKGSKIALEEKDQALSVDIDMQHDSVSTEILNEETSSKEAKPKVEALVKGTDIAPENEGPVSSVDIEVKSDIVSAGTKSEETCLEEAYAKNDEQVKSSDIAHENEGLGIEETGLKEAEQENTEQGKNSDATPEEKGVTSNVGEAVQKKENSGLEETKEKKIPTTGEHGEEKEREVEDETPITRAQNEEKEVNIDKTLDDSPKDNLQDSSPVPSRENEPTKTEASEISDETTAADKTEGETAKLPISEPTKEEELLQREDDYKLEYYDTEKEVANEENQKQIDRELNITPEITSDKNNSTSGDVGISKSEEAGEVCNLETLKDEEQSEIDNPSEGSLKGVEGVQAALDLEANNTKNGELPINQNLEPDDLGQMDVYMSESIHEDQTEETLPLTTKSETEEEVNNVQEQNFNSIEQQILEENSEDAKEIKKEVEPKLIIDDYVNEAQTPNENIKDVILAEVHEGIDKADESENTKEQVIDGESNQKEFHPESSEDERVYKEKGFDPTFTEVLKATDSDENTSGVSLQAEENTTNNDEAFVTTAADKEKINEGIVKPVDVSFALPEKGEIEEETEREVDDNWDKNYYSTAREITAVTDLKEVAEPVKAFDNDSQERNLDLLKSECAIPADKVESTKLEERSFDLVSQHSITDEKDIERENIVEENLNVTEVEETKPASAIEDIDSTRQILDVGTAKIKEDEITNDQAPEDRISEEQLQAPSSTLLPKNQEHEAETTVKTNEDVIKEVDLQSNENEAPLSTYVQKEEPSDPKSHEVAEERLETDETQEDIKPAPETVFESNQESTQAVRKDEVIRNQAFPIGISTEQVLSSALIPEEPEPEASSVVKKTEEETTRELEILDNKEKDSLATEGAEEKYSKEEFGDLKVGDKAVETLNADETDEKTIKAPITVSTGDEIITNQVLPTVISKDQLQISPPEEQENETAATLKNVDEENKNAVKIPKDEDTKDSCAKETGDKIFLQEEPREIKVSDSIKEVLGSDETQNVTKDASQTTFETNLQSIEVVPDEKIITCETIPEVQLVEQTGILLPGEKVEGITSATKSIEEEKTNEMEVLTKTAEETLSQKEEHREHKVLVADKTEDITEATETESKENSPDNEVVSRDISTDQALPLDKDEIIVEQALPAVKLLEQLHIPSPSSSVPNEQEHEIAATVKKIEEEETKEEPKKLEVSELELHAGDHIQGSLNEVPKKEGGTLNEAQKIETPETEEDTGNAEPKRALVEAPKTDIGKREIASDLVFDEAQSHESLTTIENVEIIEDHLKVATTSLQSEECQRETTIEAEKNIAKEISDKEEETSTEISYGKGSLDIEEAHSSNETSKEQTPVEAESVESTAAKITTSNKDAPPILPDPVEETSQKAESKDIKPGKETWVDREIKEEEYKEEIEVVGDSGGRKTGTESAVISLSELMQGSKEETTQVAGHKEKDPKGIKEAEHGQTHEGKDEEDEHEHEHEHEEEEHEEEEEDHPDAPILVQASKDIDAKAGRKKSHGIFSGVGSKVKHSISKVKKAITGKSTHSKTQPSS